MLHPNRSVKTELISASDAPDFCTQAYIDKVINRYLLKYKNIEDFVFLQIFVNHNNCLDNVLNVGKVWVSDCSQAVTWCLVYQLDVITLHFQFELR